MATKDAPFAGFKLPHVRIVHVGDWDAVYVEGKLIHWHDRLSAGRLLDLLGVPNETDELIDLLEDANHQKAFTDSDSMPYTLQELDDRVCELNLDRHRRELAKAQEVVDRLNDQISKLEKPATP